MGLSSVVGTHAGSGGEMAVVPAGCEVAPRFRQVLLGRAASKLLSGSEATECCVTDCKARVGSFGYFRSVFELEVSGMTFFGGRNSHGALFQFYSQAQISFCNFTSQNGTWSSVPDTPILHTEGGGSTTKVNFSLVLNSVGGLQLYFKYSGGQPYSPTSYSCETRWARSDTVIMLGRTSPIAASSMRPP